MTQDIVQKREYLAAGEVQNGQILAVVLTKNEALHIERCLRSVRQVTDRVLVVDSGSTDGTTEIAKSWGATVVHHEWVNYATQFNWAMDQVRGQSAWILRVDADEILSDLLVSEIRGQLASLRPEVHGVFVTRRIRFMGKTLMFGGITTRVLRVFRNGSGRCEMRWMDEHIKLQGNAIHFKGEVIDENLNVMDWWIAKHNGYASREAVDLLNLRYGFMPLDTVGDLRAGTSAGIKRWFKENIYSKAPAGFRALAFFLYRYVVRLGFLDGAAGAVFHVLQGFWFRYLCDVKVTEVERHMRSTGDGVTAAIHKVLGIRIPPGATDGGGVSLH